jgi:hypothetical protein
MGRATASAGTQDAPIESTGDPARRFQLLAALSISTHGLAVVVCTAPLLLTLSTHVAP